MKEVHSQTLRYKGAAEIKRNRVPSKINDAAHLLLTYPKLRSSAGHAIGDQKAMETLLSVEVSIKWALVLVLFSNYH